MTDSKEDGANDALSARLLASHDNFARLEGVSNDDLINVLEAATALSASSPPVGGSGEVKPRLSDLLAGEQVQQDAWAAPVPNGVPEGVVITESMRLAAEQILVLYPHLPPLALHLIKLVSQLPTTASPVTPEGLSGGDEIALIEAAASVMAKRRGLTYVSDPVKRERYREFLLAATNPA